MIIVELLGFLYQIVHGIGDAGLTLFGWAVLIGLFRGDLKLGGKLS